MTATLRIHLLGEFRLLVNAQPLTTFNKPRQQALLAYLLLHRHAPQSRQQIAFRFWPDSSESQAFTNLRKLFFDLRQALPDADAFITADATSVGWRNDAPFTLDVAAVEQALDQLERGTTSTATDVEQVVRLYSGELLPTCYDEWLLPMRRALHERVVNTLMQALAKLETEHEVALGLRTAEHLLRLDPLHEATYRHLMQLRALSGDRAGALRIYHECVTMLEQELGVSPATEMQALYQQLLKAEPQATPLPTPTPVEAQHIPFVGRKAEWQLLQQAWQETSRRGPQMVTIWGEAGVGKTRLVEELLRWARLRPGTVAYTRAYAAEGNLAYTAITDWLRSEAFYKHLTRLDDIWLVELARLLPELLIANPTLSPPLPMTEGWQRQRFHEALARALLAAPVPRVLVLDDVQWCDAETLAWLRYLLRFDAQTPLLVVGTVRSEAVDDVHPLQEWLLHLRREGQVEEIALSPLTLEETVVLAGHLTDAAIFTPAAQLYRETEGNPLFVVEMVRAGRLHGEGISQPPGSLPPTVQAVIGTRLAQLSPPARQLAQLAATIGRAFTFEVLAAASDTHEDLLVQGLDELWQRRIVREREQGYDFSHDKIREVAYAGISQARRRQFHRRVAHALEAIYGASLDDVSGQLAVHYEKAAEIERALEYLQRAAKAARRIYANAEAIDHLVKVLELADNLPPTERRARWRIEALTELGLIHYRGTGQLGEAEHYIREALALAGAVKLPLLQLMRLYAWLGDIVMNWQPRYEETLRIGQEGLTLLDETEESVEVALMTALISFGHAMMGDLDTARDVVLPIAGFAGKLPFSEEMWLVYNAIFFAYFHERELEPCRYWLKVILAAATEHNDLFVYGEGCFNLARFQACEGNLAASIATRAEGLQTLRQVGEVKRSNWCQIAMAWVYLYLGKLELAERYAVEALESARAVNLEYLCDLHLCLGTIALAKGAGDQAEVIFEQAEHYRKSENAVGLDCHAALGYAFLAQGKIEQAQHHFQNAVTLTQTWPAVVEWRSTWSFQEVAMPFADALRGLEVALANPERFRTVCAALRGEAVEAHHGAFDQWHLEPAQPAALFPQHDIGELPDALDALATKLDEGSWTWQDPMGDCAYSVDAGVILYAANGRDLWFCNRSAPSLLRGQAGDFVAQTACTSVSPELPAMGGILLWQDNQNYLRLDWGSRGAGEITLLGCLANRDTILGRGRLPEENAGTSVFLRVEQIGLRVRALCSADGDIWFGVGQATFSRAASLQIGLYASGNIERMLYPGPFVDGTAIRFGGFWITTIAS